VVVLKTIKGIYVTRGGIVPNLTTKNELTVNGYNFQNNTNDCFVLTFRRSDRVTPYSTLLAGGVIISTTVAISSNSRKPATVTVTVSTQTYMNTVKGMMSFI